MGSDTSGGEAIPVSDRLAAALAYAGADPFVAAVGATRLAIAITDPRRPDNPLVYVNDSFCALTGYARDEVIGRNCRFLQGPQTDPAAPAAIRAALDVGQADRDRRSSTIAATADPSGTASRLLRCSTPIAR